MIGWLYQFYISEKKDEVFDGLKKTKDHAGEHPRRYPALHPALDRPLPGGNSLGRLWLLNRPGSKPGRADETIT